jgi:hypothetical protein
VASGPAEPRIGLTALDLRIHRPRGVRETLFGFMLLPRTIDKLRAVLPGGNLGEYLNHVTGFSAYVVKRAGLDMDDFGAAVAAAPNEDTLYTWLAARIDIAQAAPTNAKLESFVVDRMSDDDQALLRARHPVMEQRPDLTRIIDILEADDDYTNRT